MCDADDTKRHEKGRDMRRVVFADEKLLRAFQLFDRKFRCCPITGTIESNPADPDYRMTHCITGFCRLDPNQPFECLMHQDTNDSVAFDAACCKACVKGFLRWDDLLVVDCAAFVRRTIDLVTKKTSWMCC